MGKTILIVDDEKAIVDILSLNLKKDGYETLCAYDGKSGLDAAARHNPDLILLDVMLPYMDGYTVCRRFREKNNTTPIIMLTAREEEVDKVMGLELGADDYITKPFSVRELMARIKTNIRRGTSAGPPEADAIVRWGRISLDQERVQVYKDQEPVDLTQREYDLMLYLTARPGRVFSREELIQEVWQYDYFGDLRAVDVTIRRLREKIEDNAANPLYIRTKRGIGYYFEPDEA